jgi:hypothetical protein
MSQDVGIFITAPGTDGSGGSQGTAANKMLMNTTIPFIKLDTQNNKAFQTITLLITNDPPEPSGGNPYKYTVLYFFPHGYKYRPAVECLFYVSNPGASTANTQTYFQNEGQLSAHTVDDYCVLYAIADATNVYIVCLKWNDGFGLPNLLTGTNVQITPHVFVEDIGVV